MTDIVERLLMLHVFNPACLVGAAMSDAADEIIRLRQALRDILQAERWNEEAFQKGCDLEQAISMELMSNTVRIARAALGEDRT